MTDKPEVMNGESLDIAAQRRAELKQLFPGVFTETKDANGQIVSSIDFERLKAELGTFSDFYEGRRERYGMEWPGKRECMKIIQEPSRASLRPCPEESIDWETTKNIFIEGDNLEVLKLLQKSYYGKVKMIYIDPPYNTGKEFIYPDNYQQTLDTYLAYTGQLDDDGKKFSTNTASEGRFHSKWLNMLYPRLYLAKNLLADDGVIFISIDDNEVTNLKCICDELFGEENFLSQIIVQSNKRGQTYKDIAKCHEYILVYYKSESSSLSELDKTDGSLPFEDAYGGYDLWELRNRNPKFGRHNRPNLFYPVYVDKDAINEEGLAKVSLTKSDLYSVEVFPRNSSGDDSCWRWGKDKFIKDGLNAEPVSVWARQKRDGEWNIYEKSRKNTTKAKSIWQDNAVISEQGTVESGRLGLSGVLEFPKPLELVKRCIKLATSEDDIILDFFAGSGTTFHAALLQSLEDGFNRQCICVQLPEPTFEIVNEQKIPKRSSPEAFSQGFETIAEVSKERIRRSINTIRGENAETIDTGVKVFKLDKSSFREWNTNDEQDNQKLIRQLELAVENVIENSNEDDILFELLLKSGFSLSESISRLSIAGKNLFSIANGALIICLEEQITTELIDSVVELEPMQFICLDKGFQGNDQLKANTVQAFKARSKDSETEMVFKVV